MAITADIKKSVTDTSALYAVVGVTDLAVERVRRAHVRAGDVRADLEAGKLQAKAQQVPTLAVTRMLEAAGRAEETYEDLAGRGKKLVDRIKRQRATQELVDQGKATISRSKAAVTTVRRGAGSTQSAAKATVTTAQREADEVITETRATARKRTTGTKSAAKRTATTARKRAATTKSATKATGTTARKTARSAAKATEAASAKVGD